MDGWFRLKSDFHPPAWQLTTEEKVFLGFHVHMAKAILDEGSSLVAWLTQEIPIPSGPERFGGLPGVILILASENFNYIAREVSLDPELRVDHPTEGREISEEEFLPLANKKIRKFMSSL